MKLLIIRHAEPDYEHDTLTEKGWREAGYLAKRLEREKIDAVYVSPMGRAKDTASCTLHRKGIQATECTWLQEFNAPKIWRPDVKEKKKVAWDWLPQDWMKEEQYFSYEQWMNTETMQEGKVGEEYQKIVNAFDELLATHGYRREEHYYRAEQANDHTLAFFCHFGLQCVLLSHLLNTSPMVLWHGTCAAPSSVTTLYTEERRKGIASFRISSFGDISHLYANGEEPSFAARFCECYDNVEERHD